MNDSKKRNRLGNFDQEDIDLFLNLVNENKTLIDSGKQEDKKKGWDTIAESFNASCTGIKRDIGALKMKLKNLKAQTKRVKLEDGSVVERLDECQDSEQDASVNEVSPKAKNSRKRSKVWTTEETEQFSELVEKNFHCLDTSLTRESLELRNQAWDGIVVQFNRSKPSANQRDINELKIKLKNMKAKRTNFKTESDSGNSAVEQSFIEVEPTPEEVVKIKRTKTVASTPVLKSQSPPARSQRSSLPTPTRYPQRAQIKTFEVVVDSLDPINDYSDEDDYPQPVEKNTSVTINPVNPAEDKEEARIRKENLLLKNSVLRKKERLLEIQISLAERNLRRHQLQ